MTRVAKELSCRELTEFLSDYLAGDLDPDTRSAFEEHLAGCPDCVAYLHSYGETIRLARDAYTDSASEADVPEELVRAILRARARRAGRR